MLNAMCAGLESGVSGLTCRSSETRPAEATINTDSATAAAHMLHTRARSRRGFHRGRGAAIACAVMGRCGSTQTITAAQYRSRQDENGHDIPSVCFRGRVYTRRG